MTSMFRGLIVALSMTFLPGVSIAQAWPDRPVRFFVSFPAGSSPDIILRLLADRLSRQMGQQVVIENRPGGNSIIGAQATLRSPADGYSFYFSGGTAITSHSFTVKDLPYDPLRDFVPVAMYAKTHHLVLAPSGLPARNLAELVAMDKTNPGSISFGSFGRLTSSGLIGEYLNKTAGMKLLQVPYANGAQMIQDTIAGRVQVIFDTLSVVEPHIKSGALKILASTAAKRLPGLETVPTVAETYPGFETSGWFGVVARSGTPQTIVQGMNRQIDDALKNPELTKRLTDTGWLVTGADTPEGFGTFWRTEFDKWRKVADAIGLKPE